MTAKPLPDVATFRQFADLIGRKPSYVTQLRQAERLVLTDDGKRVVVAASIERIAATRDPSKIGTVARHAAARAEDAAPAVDDAIADDDEPTAQEARDPKYQASRAEREFYNAQLARLAFERDIGKVMEAAAVEAGLAAAGTQLRKTLEQLPDTLAPRLAAESSEQRIRSIMGEEIHHALQDLAREFAAIAKSAG